MTQTETKLLKLAAERHLAGRDLVGNDSELNRLCQKKYLKNYSIWDKHGVPYGPRPDLYIFGITGKGKWLLKTLEKPNG